MCSWFRRMHCNSSSNGQVCIRCKWKLASAKPPTHSWCRSAQGFMSKRLRKTLGSSPSSSSRLSASASFQSACEHGTRVTTCVSGKLGPAALVMLYWIGRLRWHWVELVAPKREKYAQVMLKRTCVEMLQRVDAESILIGYVVWK